MYFVGALLVAILTSPNIHVVATPQGNDLRARTNDDATGLPAKDQTYTIVSTYKTLSGDTLPIMTGTDKTTMEPGIPSMQPSFSVVSGTWSDSFMPANDKTSTPTLTSSMPAKDQGPSSISAKDQTSTSIPAKDQTANPSVPAKDETTTFSIPAKDQSSTSVPAKDQTTSSSVPVKDQTGSSLLPANDQTSTSVPAKDQTTSSSTPVKDFTSSNSNQIYSFSVPAIGKDEKTYSQPEISASSSELTELASSTMPVVVTYSFLMPPSSTPSFGASVKTESSLSVAVSSFTVPSVIYSFSLQSSNTERPTSKPPLGPLPTQSEKPSPTNKSKHLPDGQDSSSKVDKPHYNATSSVIPLWTPDMLGNAYGGGFVNTPSIYVTLAPNPTITATGVPPGYGFSVKPETPQITDKSSSPYSNSIGTSSDKTGSGGSLIQIIPLSGVGSSYRTDEYGIPTSGTSSTTGSTDCCSASTTLSVGQIDNSGIPVSVSESSPTTYTFGEVIPTPIITAPYGNNASLSAGNGSSNSNVALINPTFLPEYRGFAVKNTIGLTAGLLGILVFVFLI